MSRGLKTHEVLRLRWPITVTSKQNAHSKFKSLTANSKSLTANHSKFKSLTGKYKSTTANFKPFTSNSNRSHQTQIAHSKIQIAYSKYKYGQCKTKTGDRGLRTRGKIPERGVGGSPHNGLYGGAPPERASGFRLQASGR